MTVNVGNLDAGDTKFEYGRTMTFETDGTVSGGDAVKYDASGLLTPTTANEDTWIGVAEQSTIGDDDFESVHVAGLGVVVQCDTGVSEGDVLVPSATNDGHFESHAAGTYVANPDTGGSDIASNHPIALGSTSADGELIVALFR